MSLSFLSLFQRNVTSGDSLKQAKSICLIFRMPQFPSAFSFTLLHVFPLSLGELEQHVMSRVSYLLLALGILLISSVLN